MGGLSLAGNLGAGVAGALGVGGGYSTSSATRKLIAETVNKLADSAFQASSVIRSLYSSVITQASQAEQDVVQTRTVTNHNHCYAFTVLYYKVLRHYRVVYKDYQ